MTTARSECRDTSTLIGRWSGLGPYYAMFPVEFAFEVVRTYTAPGDWVLDPFAGRGTSIFAAASQERFGVGVEINPVGWLYGQVKLGPAREGAVLRRLSEISTLAQEPHVLEGAEQLPEFYHHCFSTTTRAFLLMARDCLDWRQSRIDRTLMAFILVYLHGKSGSALSNQMRQSKAMSPDYSIRWWTSRGLLPPEIDVRAFFEQRIKWRYSRGSMPQAESRILLGDSISKLPLLRRKTSVFEPARLLFTSPPYCGVTNYHYDQWLRLWMLGGPELPGRIDGEWKGKFTAENSYTRLLEGVFGASRSLLSEDATIYIRTDARQFTLSTTKSVLRKVFPNKSCEEIQRPLLGKSQTGLFREIEDAPGEVDLILRSR